MLGLAGGLAGDLLRELWGTARFRGVLLGGAGPAGVVLSCGVVSAWEGLPLGKG